MKYYRIDTKEHMYTRFGQTVRRLKYDFYTTEVQCEAKLKLVRTMAA